MQKDAQPVLAVPFRNGVLCQRSPVGLVLALADNTVDLCKIPGAIHERKLLSYAENDLQNAVMAVKKTAANRAVPSHAARPGTWRKALRRTKETPWNFPVEITFQNHLAFIRIIA
jgi:hypothetical protein